MPLTEATPWQRYRDALWNHDLNRPLLYQPIEHEAFRGWEAQQPCEERWRMIWPHCATLTPGRALDLGCHTGWFCRRFARAGWNTIGVEKSALHVEIAEALDRELAIPPTAYTCDDLLSLTLPDADVALCLSVAMYLFPAEDPAAGWAFFARLSEAAPRLFLDFGGMYAHRLPFTRDTVAGQMADRTGYRRATFLGDTRLEGRPLFLFEV